MDDHDIQPGMFTGKVIAHRPASISRTIIDEEQFVVVTHLDSNAIKATHKIFLNVVYGDDDTKFHTDIKL
jgi:hypothetical protein